jgi:hypothetical protein
MMMNRSVTALMAIMIVAMASTVLEVAAFSPAPVVSTTTTRSGQIHHRHYPVVSENILSTTTAPIMTTTSLSLKIDPKEIKNKKGNALGAAKGAAYGGSIVIAVLLPVIFLIWSASN